METGTEQSFMSQFIPTIISLVITGLLSVIIGILLEKFRNRLSIVKYRLFKQPVAISSQNSIWGDIKVFHNNREIKHIALLTFEIENTGNLDLDNVHVDVSVDPDSQILAQSGYYNNTKLSIVLEDKYYELFNKILQKNVENMKEKEKNPQHETPAQLLNEVSLVMTNKKFNIPVFNRGEKATFNLLVENFKGQVPNGFINIVHKSVRFEPVADIKKENKKSLLYTLLCGLLIYGICYFFLFKNFSSSVIPLVLSLILGLSYAVLGLLIYSFIKYVIRLLK